MAKAQHTNKGFTLVEVLTVVAILGIVGAIAVPAMLSWLSNQGIQAAGRDLYGNLRKAQSTAIKENRNCAVRFDGVNGTEGYTVYVDSDRDFNFDPTGDDRLLAEVKWSQYRNVELDSLVDFPAGIEEAIFFQPNSLPVDATSAFLTDTREIHLTNSTGRKLILTVNISGNISLTEQL